MLATLTRVQIQPSLDGEGWTVRIGDSHWRFAREEFARVFAGRLESDESFSEAILDHAYNHDWEKCKPELCLGLLWQYIQGLP